MSGSGRRRIDIALEEMIRGVRTKPAGTMTMARNRYSGSPIKTAA
jgi:hypothetical protein